MSPQADRPDYCGCIKAPGEWGNGGWHWTTQDEAYCVAWADLRFREKYGERVNRMDPKWEALHVLAQRYIGRPLAVVHCPQYQRVAAANFDRARARSSAPAESLV